MPLCIFCNQELPPTALQSATETTCPGCRRHSRVLVFPAIHGTSPPARDETIPEEGAVVCFYNPNRVATDECFHCGVLMSRPWAAVWGLKTVCLKCLEHLRTQGRDRQFQGTLVLWDTIALRVALLPVTIIFWWAVFVSAPAALFLAIRHWNSPRSMVSPGRWKLGLAATLASLQILVVAALLIGNLGGKLKIGALR